MLKCDNSFENIKLEFMYVSCSSSRKPAFKSTIFLGLRPSRMLLCVSLLLVTRMSAKYISPISKYNQFKKNFVWTDTDLLAKDVGKQLLRCLTSLEGQDIS